MQEQACTPTEWLSSQGVLRTVAQNVAYSCREKCRNELASPPLDITGSPHSADQHGGANDSS